MTYQNNAKTTIMTPKEKNIIEERKKKRHTHQTKHKKTDSYPFNRKMIYYFIVIEKMGRRRISGIANHICRQAE